MKMERITNDLIEKKNIVTKKVYSSKLEATNTGKIVRKR
jgi:hypothetical protein